MFVQLKTWWIQSKVWLWTTNESGKWTCTNLLVLRLSHPNISMMMFRPLTVQQADLDLSLIRCSLATSEPVACWLWDGAILNLVVQRTNTSNFWTFLQENKILHCKMYRLWKIWRDLKDLKRQSFSCWKSQPWGWKVAKYIFSTGGKLHPKSDIQRCKLWADQLNQAFLFSVPPFVEKWRNYAWSQVINN